MCKYCARKRPVTSVCLNVSVNINAGEIQTWGVERPLQGGAACLAIGDRGYFPRLGMSRFSWIPIPVALDNLWNGTTSSGFSSVFLLSIVE